MVEFVFTEELRQIAAKEAIRRRSYNKQLNTKPRNNAPVTGHKVLDMDLLGAAAELAVAYYLNLEQHLYKEERPIRGSCDLPGIDVKCRSKHSYDLLVQLDDNFSKIFVLVTIESKRTFIHGWIYGYNVKGNYEIKSFVAGRPCYAIPKQHLRPIEDLRCLIPTMTAKTY